MRKIHVLVLLLAVSVCSVRAAHADTAPMAVTSPDGAVSIAFTLDGDGAPVYSISYRGKVIIATSHLGLDLVKGGLLGKGMRVTGSRRDSHDATYPLVVGKAREARDHYEELTVSLEETAEPHRKLDLVLRAYDDGAAFRYVVPEQPGLARVDIASERTEFRFPTDLECWTLQLGGFRTSYEGEFDRITSGRIRQDAIVGLPLVAKTRDESATFAISEADLVDYAGMYFAGLEGGGFGVRSRLSPRRDDEKLAVRTEMKPGGVRSPWRIVMIAAEPSKLIESTLVANLSTPNAIGDASWVRPGRSAWDWWSGPAPDGLPNVGMNDETMRHFIDLAGEMKLEYMLVDAGWYSKGPGFGDGMDLHADITKTIPEIHLPELIAYAKERNVGIWVWIHWKLADDQMDKAFPLYERLGIRGVKIDFMDSDDQDMVAFYHRVLQTAAKHHLMVDLHGAFKPTGLARTYPNYVTQEGVMGAEYNKWSARVTPTHNVTLAFTRLLLGPMDYTPGGFRNTTPQSFEIHFVEPRVMSTRAQQLAMYVVYESPFACISDSPGAYRGQPGADFLSVVPTSWDETRALGGDVGEYVVVARRKGSDWYLGAMTNERGRDIEVPLAFLGPGEYRATVYADGAQPTDVVSMSATIKDGKIEGSPVLRLRLAPSGGAAVRISSQ